MTHIDEVELLRRRSLRMLNHAEHCITTGDYDLASFLAEQAVQLYLKSIILELTGEVPRTHVIRQLFHILRTIVKNKELIDEFMRKNRRLLVGLEEAYLALRYLFRIYEKEEAEELINFAKEVINFVRDIKGKT
ncbi:MAG: HEPN domain-containing protein [Thermoprotei archaeon]|nr:HEPN domain-containing protein [Thermoprotei archaeon]